MQENLSQFYLPMVDLKFIQANAGPKKVKVSLSQRNKKKFVTVVSGLKTFGEIFHGSSCFKLAMNICGEHDI